MEIVLLILPGFLFWWFLKEGDETGWVLKLSHWYFALPFATFGFVFFSISTLILGLVRCLVSSENYVKAIEWVLTHKAPYLGSFILTCIAASILGDLASRRINLIVDIQKQQGDGWYHWVRLLRIFMPETTDNYAWLRIKLEEYGVVIVTTKSNKVYYAVPRQLTKSFAGEEGFLELNPIASGYRNEMQKIIVTNDYSDQVVKEIENDDRSFSIIIPFREVTSVIQYDADAFSFRLLMEK